MDLKIKDLAELLSVSESTIRRWLLDGKIPAYKLNQQYRFNPTEIEDWVMSQKLRKQEEPVSLKQETTVPEDEENLGSGGSKQFSLYRALNRGGIYYRVPGNSKEDIIRNTMKNVASHQKLDAELLTELLLEREKLAPTALNHGIGVPHTRDFLLNSHQNIVTLAFPEHAVAYGALDELPVHSLFFLFACDEKQHLHLLAKIAHLSSNKEALELLKSKPNKLEFLEFVKKWEADIGNKKAKG